MNFDVVILIVIGWHTHINLGHLVCMHVRFHFVEVMGFFFLDVSIFKYGLHLHVPQYVKDFFLTLHGSLCFTHMPT